MLQFDTFQKFSKDGMDAAMTSFGALSRGIQSAAVEAVDYAKRSFEQGSQTVEKLAGARTLDTAVEIQGEYLRAAYENFVAQATKMGELAAATAKEAYAPVETLVVKARAA
ncbi:phasin family protein [Enterovirga aerilata]|uniref:Phasin family protein n=1 Tax=Enterovirga aerilata TaxID=2730920 RepID=A0A849HXU7_9HYPH|nr:phasin family protein [Enterovirga sp. DB1703]NNM71932.1 phasin family protein [Enterovirga sp. DB1703]